MRKIIGLDLDGCLANFNAGYRRMLAETSGRILIPAGEEPPCWYYAQEYGYTAEEDAAAWDAIERSAVFWQSLNPLPGAIKILSHLWERSDDDEVYFITTREGRNVKRQSENWLQSNGLWDDDFPTVLIARGEKGLIANALGLTHFIDDRPENCISVRIASPTTQVYMLAKRYNETQRESVEAQGVVVIQTLDEFSAALRPAKQAA